MICIALSRRRVRNGCSRSGESSGGSGMTLGWVW